MGTSSGLGLDVQLTERPLQAWNDEVELQLFPVGVGAGRHLDGFTGHLVGLDTAVGVEPVQLAGLDGLVELVTPRIALLRDGDVHIPHPD